MPKFDIAGRGKIWFIISLLVIVPGIISMATRGFNFGIVTAITLTQFMLKLSVNSKVVESPSAYGADGFVLFDVAKEVKS